MGLAGKFSEFTEGGRGEKEEKRESGPSKTRASPPKGEKAKGEGSLARSPFPPLEKEKK